MGKKLQIILAAILLSTALAGCGGGSGGNSAAETVEPSGNEPEIIIKGSNFDFDQAEYTVSVGEAVKIVYQDVEGGHGIQIEDTNIKLRNNDETVVKFNEAGTYDIVCNVYCGAGHTNMRAKLIVQ